MPNNTWMYHRDGQWAAYDPNTFVRPRGAFSPTQQQYRMGFRGSMSDNRAAGQGALGADAQSRGNFDGRPYYGPYSGGTYDPRYNDPSFRRGANFGDQIDDPAAGNLGEGTDAGAGIGVGTE
jgi:hypothetical protein